MRRSRRAVLVALAPLGTVVGHALGYLLAGEDAALEGAHGYLRPVVWVAAALATAALAWIAVTGPRRRGAVRLSWLAVVQVGLFVAVEALEHAVADGHGSAGLLAEPSLRWGLVAQVASAAVLALVAVAARASGARLRVLLCRRRRPLPAVARGALALATAPARSITLASPASERGPPRHLVHA